jgi:hypothetical protein
MDGITIGHNESGHIGGRSMELEQSGCILPSTHWQAQSAMALVESTILKNKS